MLKHKTILAITLICSLFLIGYINSSDAAQITSLSASVPDDWGSGANVSAHLATDEGIDYIDWYVDNTYRQTSMHDNDTTWVNVDLGSFDGALIGNKYEIKAIAFFWDEDAEESVSDEESNDITVYRPKYDSSTKLDVSGSVYLYYIDYTHPYISPSGYAGAYNNGNEWNKFRYIFHRFRHQVTGPGINISVNDETEGGIQTLPEGQSYHASTPSNFPINVADGEEGANYTSSVYMRLEVSGIIKVNNPNGGANDVHKVEDWYVGASPTFTLVE